MKVGIKFRMVSIPEVVKWEEPTVFIKYLTTIRMMI